MALEHLHGLRRHSCTANFNAERAHHLRLLRIDEHGHTPLTTGAAESGGHRTILIQAPILVKLHRFVTLRTDKFHGIRLLAGSSCMVSKNVRTRSPIWNNACPAGEVPYSRIYGVPRSPAAAMRGSKGIRPSSGTPRGISSDEVGPKSGCTCSQVGQTYEVMFSTSPSTGVCKRSRARVIDFNTTRCDTADGMVTTTVPCKSGSKSRMVETRSAPGG